MRSESDFSGYQLPPDYRPSESNVSLSGFIFAIGCPSGKVFVIKFSISHVMQIFDSSDSSK
jgi:hypothetical protein